jgi:hypothetical protein
VKRIVVWRYSKLLFAPIERHNSNLDADPILLIFHFKGTDFDLGVSLHPINNFKLVHVKVHQYEWFWEHAQWPVQNGLV